MSKEALISVIVPVYNVELWLRECLNSIAAQTYRNIEVILVDDGSTDSSGAICEEYAAKFPAIFRAVHKANGGSSSARNCGLDEAKGEYIYFVDSDDWIAADLLEKTLRLCVKYKADVVCFGTTNVYPKRSIPGSLPSRECVLSPRDALGKLLQGRECEVGACDKLYRREMFQTIRFPDGEINEDAAIMFRLFDHARKIALLPERLYYYRHRDGSITTSNFGEKNLVVLKNAREALRWIEERYPDLLPEAREYYAKILVGVLSKLQLLQGADRAAYKETESEVKAELRKFHAGLPDYKWRFKYLLMTLNAYGVCLKAYNRLFRGYADENRMQRFDSGAVYPAKCFCPDEFGGLSENWSENTVSVHHYSATWKTPEEHTVAALKRKVKKGILTMGKIPQKTVSKIVQIVRGGGYEVTLSASYGELRMRAAA